MLLDVEQKGLDSIVSWLADGTAFKVHNKDKFVAIIMPQYFYSNKFKSFQRNLNLWGFESIRQGPNKGACYNHCFVRDQPYLCHQMTRQKITKFSGKRESENEGGEQEDNGNLSESAQVARIRRTAPSNQLVSESYWSELYDILDNEEYKDIITWMPHGRSFCMLDSKRFEEVVLPKHFTVTTEASFIQDLEQCGFKRKKSLCYYHEVRRSRRLLV